LCVMTIDVAVQSRGGVEVDAVQRSPTGPHKHQEKSKRYGVQE